MLGRYVATKRNGCSVATDARSLRSDQAWPELGRYVSTERNGCSVAEHAFGHCVATFVELLSQCLVFPPRSFS
ncbi:hypothetical protein F2Q69_00007328 [Brassica cretica]|uniref:Uncharacterized protein n=1 Tax=Brassica cretica TaxID=69181 RepID=A0A8S9P1C0_BRACR|nr:hypothetical protein F2Q69_00007328 [Brassica cretica]